MQSTSSLQLGGRRHKKSYSTDTLASQGKKRFLSIVSGGMTRMDSKEEHRIKNDV